MLGLLLVLGLFGAAEAPAAYWTAEVGKWPERLVVLGDDAWVTESGQRQVAQVHLPTGKVKARVKVGRLPVQIELGDDGRLYTLVHTDGKVVSIDPKTRRSRTVAKVPGCPESFRLRGDDLYVLLWDKCTSESASILKVDLKTHATLRSKPLPASGFDVLATETQVIVGHSGGVISVLDAKTLEVLTALKVPGEHQVAALGSDTIYMGGMGGVVALSLTGEVKARWSTSGVVTALAVGESLLVGTHEGVLWRLDPATLAERGQVPVFNGELHGLAWWGKIPVATSFRSEAWSIKVGALLVFETSLAAPIPPIPPIAPIPSVAPTSPVPPIPPIAPISPVH